MVVSRSVLNITIPIVWYFPLCFIVFTDVATEDDRKELFKELRLMANVGDHPNIVNLVGACSRGGR